MGYNFEQKRILQNVDKLSIIESRGELMHTIPLREFQQKGPVALRGISTEPVLLIGRAAKFFIIPTQGDDVDSQYKEYLKAMAMANLSSWHQRAKETGLSEMTLEEINKEIGSARRQRKAKKKGK